MKLLHWKNIIPEISKYIFPFPQKNAHVVRDKNCSLNFFILYLRQTQTMVAKTSYFPPQVAVNIVSFYVEKI